MAIVFKSRRHARLTVATIFLEGMTSQQVLKDGRAKKNLLKSGNDALHGSNVLLLESELLARSSLWSSLAVGRGGDRGGSRSRRRGAQITVWRQRQPQAHGGGGLRAREGSSSSRERREHEAPCCDGREGEGGLGLVVKRWWLRTWNGLRLLLALWNGLRRSSGSIAVERFVIHEF
jgi:hypothetical protein